MHIEQHYLRDAALPVVKTREHMDVVKCKDITSTLHFRRDANIKQNLGGSGRVTVRARLQEGNKDILGLANCDASPMVREPLDKKPLFFRKVHMEISEKAPAPS